MSAADDLPPPPPRFSVSIDDNMSANDARNALNLLATEDFRQQVRDNPSYFYEALGLVLGEGVVPDTVILPTKREAQEALDVLDTYGEFRFKFEPFGFYTPAKNPFIGILLLAAKVNDGG